jgi:hypothetical protein
VRPTWATYRNLSLKDHVSPGPCPSDISLKEEAPPGWGIWLSQVLHLPKAREPSAFPGAGFEDPRPMNECPLWVASLSASSQEATMATGPILVGVGRVSSLPPWKLQCSLWEMTGVWGITWVLEASAGTVDLAARVRCDRAIRGGV